MIFVTVGAQLPFDRLVQTVDRWAQQTGRDDVFAQIGRTASPPKHIRWTAMLDPIEYRNRFWEADVVVAHAGAGTIITAMEMSKPLLVMPRLVSHNETRNNHQIATAQQFYQRTNSGGLRVADDEMQLSAALQTIDDTQPLSRIGAYASFALLKTVRQFLETGTVPEPEVDQTEELPPAVIGRTTDHQQEPTRRKAA